MSTASEHPPAAADSLDAAPAALHLVEDPVAAAVRLYESGLSANRIAPLVGVSRTQVYRLLHAAGVELRPGGARRKHPVPEPRVCACGCGEIFTPTGVQAANGHGRFARPECKARAQRLYPDPGERVCAREGCDARFRPVPRDAARGDGLYCSPDCYHLASRRHPDPGERVCARDGCDAPVHTYPSWAAKGGGKFCSRACEASHGVKYGRGGYRRVILDRAGPRTRQRWLGRWAPRGGRPANTPSAELAAIVEHYAERGWGRRSILDAAEVREAGGSERLVGRVLRERRERLEREAATAAPAARKLVVTKPLR